MLISVFIGKKSVHQAEISRKTYYQKKKTSREIRIVNVNNDYIRVF